MLSSTTTRYLRSSLRAPASKAARRILHQQQTISRSSAAAAAEQEWLNHAIALVRQHDAAAGYLPGRLLPNATMRMAYYAVRAFWVETGLRFGSSTARVPPNSTPSAHLQYWQDGIDAVFSSGDDDSKILVSSLPTEYQHPTLQLLQTLIKKHNVPWDKQHFDQVLAGRRRDLDIQQYETLNELVQHAEASCGNLSALVLESGNMTAITNPVAHRAARHVGICHGMAAQLRQSIPVLSTTGRLIVPAELCAKYGVRSPRYLLSALSLGEDAACVAAMQRAVADVVAVARDHLQQARDLRTNVLAEPGGSVAPAVLLPAALASETFLDRLQAHRYQLTDRNLRSVGHLEHIKCAVRMIAAYYQSKY